MWRCEGLAKVAVGSLSSTPVSKAIMILCVEVAPSLAGSCTTRTRAQLVGPLR